MALLSAGFHPQTCPVLASKLKDVLKTAVETFVKRYRITVPMSCDAFIVPGNLYNKNNCRAERTNYHIDPIGVLEEGQIHIKIGGSNMNLAGPDGLPTDIVQGYVLVSGTYYYVVISYNFDCRSCDTPARFHRTSRRLAS